MLLLLYPRCTTCQKAKKWLDDNHVEYTERHIVEDNPTYEELREWYSQSGLPIKKFFNTSGLRYKELNLKDKIPTMTEDELLKLLATDGMLVKRPLVVNGDRILTGFKEKEWSDARAKPVPWWRQSREPQWWSFALRNEAVQLQ